MAQPAPRLVWQEATVAGRGLSLHARRVIEPVAPPVLLLHGLGVAGSVWQGFARRLAPALAAVAPDLRGHGQSDAPAHGYELADYAADLVELIADLRLPLPLGVVGHSLGALVALVLAELRPELVRWLALLDPPLDAGVQNPEVGCVARLRHAPAGELERYLLERNPGGGPLLAQALAELFRQASDAAFDAMLTPAAPRDAAGPSPVPRLEPGTGLGAAAAAAWVAAGHVRQPTLILQADPGHGGLLGTAAAEALRQRLAQGQLLAIGGASHSLHASHPAEVAQAILSFAQSVEHAAPSPG